MAVRQEMHLKLLQQHRSIRELPDSTLPRFSILTGANGSGKTHFLEAVELGKISVTEISQPEIKRFDWISFAPQIDESANPITVRQQRENGIRQVFDQLRNFRNALPQHFVGNQIVGDPILLDADKLALIDHQALAAVLNKCHLRGQTINDPTAIGLAQNLVNQRSQYETSLLRNIASFGNLAQILIDRSQKSGRPMLSLSENEVREFMPLNWAPNNSLQFQIAGWFVAWHSAWEYNKVNAYYATQHGESHRAYLADEVFRQRYGPEPWDLTNRVMTRAGVRHRFNRPTTTLDNLEQNFELRLIDESDSTEIQVRDLSSGEKILLAITLLFYQTTGEMGLAALPKMLLLDEVDAHLHPSFTKILINISSEELVQKCGLAVI